MRAGSEEYLDWEKYQLRQWDVHHASSLAPLLAFDAEGHRLGYGGGYYDRTLEALRAQHSVLAIGVAYAGQEMAQLPREAHDHTLDAILTENGLRHFSASRVTRRQAIV